MSAHDPIISPSLERRGKPRVNCSYPAILRGGLADGSRYEARGVLTNMSVSGMYLLTRRSIQSGELLSVVVRLSTGALNREGAPQLAATGQALRVEPKTDGSYGVALKLHYHRFL
jgi:hypothetical protein